MTTAANAAAKAEKLKAWGSALGGAGSMLGSAVNLGLGITSLITANQQHKDMMSKLDEQLQLQKDQFAESKNRYNTALANQGKGIASLGSSFGSTLESNAPSQNAQASTPSTASLDSSTQSQTPPKAQSFENPMTRM